MHRFWRCIIISVFDRSNLSSKLELLGKEGLLKIIYTNADSLTNKLELIKLIVLREKPEIVAITEVLPKNYKLKVLVL